MTEKEKNLKQSYDQNSYFTKTIYHFALNI